MDEQYMRGALDLAQAAKASGNFPFGAVIVKDGKIVGRGKCEEVTEHDVTRHAELLAVSDACRTLGSRDLGDCTLYTSGEPCNMCAAAVFSADIGRVVVGISRADLPHFFRLRNIGIHELAADSSHHIEIVLGILKDEAAALFAGI